MHGRLPEVTQDTSAKIYVKCLIDCLNRCREPGLLRKRREDVYKLGSAAISHIAIMYESYLPGISPCIGAHPSLVAWKP